MRNAFSGFSFGNSHLSSESPCYVIAEIGNNHQGSLETALEMIKVAAQHGVQAVKFQKRDNETLYTRSLYNKEYDNVNSYGRTYGEHREFLEFGRKEYEALISCALENSVEFMSTAFDFRSVDFLEELGVTSYKIASGDVTNTPLLSYVAKLGKPMFVSTGAASLEEVKIAYEAVTKYNNEICLLYCTAGYPTDYAQLNLRVIETYKALFPHALIGYSGHDNGILAAVVAYILGAKVVEKHFTLNRAWKGTDHKFSLEPEGLRKQVRDLRRVDISLGNGIKVLHDFERGAREKMGKGLYTSRPMCAGAIVTEDAISLKSPGGGVPPYSIDKVIGKKLRLDLEEESLILWEHLD